MYFALIFFRLDPLDETWINLVQILKKERRAGLSVGNEISLSVGKAVESRCTLSISDFVAATQTICADTHTSSCDKCDMLMSACTYIKKHKVVALGQLWRETTDLEYKSGDAKQRFIQAPLTLLLLPDVNSGKGQIMSARSLVKHLMRQLQRH